MTSETPLARRCIDFPLEVGKSPVWDPATGRLLFVDILAPALFRLDPESGAVERWDMPEALGAIGLCPNGQVVAGLRSGVFLYDLDRRKLELLVRPEPDRPQNRLNDGKVGPDGAFWIGSMDDRADKTAVAALYRVTADGGCTRMVEGLTVSNGLGWTPDGRTMFHSDSRQTWICAWDFDPATGAMSNRREIRRMRDDEGRPDGAAVDAEGCYWSAGVSAGCLNRIGPDGTLLRSIAMPCLSPTMPCFGPDGRLFVTSLTAERDGRRDAGRSGSWTSAWQAPEWRGSANRWRWPAQRQAGGASNHGGTGNRSGGLGCRGGSGEGVGSVGAFRHPALPVDVAVGGHELLVHLDPPAGAVGTQFEIAILRQIGIGDVAAGFDFRRSTSLPP